MSHWTDSELLGIFSEARRMVDRACGVNISHGEYAERVRCTEAALTRQAYLRAIRPYVDAKFRLIQCCLPRYLATRQADGSFKLEPQEPDYPAETKAALATIDGYINEIAKTYLRNPPFPTVGNQGH